MMLASVSGMLGILWYSFRRLTYGLVTTIDVVFIALPDGRWVVGSKLHHVTMYHKQFREFRVQRDDLPYVLRDLPI